jgi:hypothetical protein
MILSSWNGLKQGGSLKVILQGLRRADPSSHETRYFDFTICPVKTDHAKKAALLCATQHWRYGWVRTVVWNVTWWDRHLLVHHEQLLALDNLPLQRGGPLPD